MTVQSDRDETYLLGGPETLIEAYDAVLLDLDGVVYRGPLAVEHAADSIAAVRAAGLATAFVTNNANRLPQTVAAHLTDLGIPATAPEVMTSSQAAAAIVARKVPAGARVMPVGGPGLEAALEEVGLTLVEGADDSPVAVVQGFAPGVGWLRLAEAAYAIQRGAWFVATNLDATIPTERGTAPGNGSLVGVVRIATGVEPVSAGKPKPEIFWQAAERVGSRRPIVVGDRLDTDLEGARAAGMPGLHVLTGVDDARAVVLAAAAERPLYVSCDLRGLLVAHPAPERDDAHWWRCGSAAALVRDGAARVSDDGVATDLAAPARITLDALRALCCAAWEAADRGDPLRDLPALEVDRA